jgi:hypothetical protein
MTEAHSAHSTGGGRNVITQSQSSKRANDERLCESCTRRSLSGRPEHVPGRAGRAAAKWGKHSPTSMNHGVDSARAVHEKQQLYHHVQEF